VYYIDVIGSRRELTNSFNAIGQFGKNYN